MSSRVLQIQWMYYSVFKVAFIRIFFPSIIEWKRTNAPSFGCLLPERCLPATPPAAEADVRDQLHGDGQSDGRASHLLALQRTAD